jgi:putative membrane protein
MAQQTLPIPIVVPDLPAELVRAMADKDSGNNPSTILAQYRTQLALRRTGLADLRSHLANERTHLAYVRTAISLMSFGITLNRFTVFLEQQGTLVAGKGTRSMLHDTGNVGSGMLVLGLALIVWSLYRYWHVNRDIVTGQFQPLKGSVFAYTVFVILLGGLSALWLFFG